MKRENTKQEYTGQKCTKQESTHPGSTKPRIYNEDDHCIKQDHVDKDALEVIFKLKQAGHTAYLVGGGVRDLLLQKTPKDFDISTSAKPEEIKELFKKRCLLIGKRFRLAHIRQGNHILEVSTFRSGDPDHSSLIVHDNRWGSPEEDVLRRDFTINALFYDPTTHCVLDYVGGYPDLKERMLRVIGDPVNRFRQDPVRMIRLLKFRARFDFHVDPKCARGVAICQEEIIKSAPARVLEEMFKMLESGASEPFFTLMHEHNFLEILFPCFHHFFSDQHASIARKYLHALDTMQKSRSRPLDRSVQLAALVYPILEQECLTLMKDRQVALRQSDIINLSYSLLQGINMSSFAHFPKKIIAITHFINTLQYRFTPLQGPPRLARRLGPHDEVNFAFDLLELRSHIDPDLKEPLLKWKKSLEHKNPTAKNHPHHTHSKPPSAPSHKSDQELIRP